jgi:hypothetical protein
VFFPQWFGGFSGKTSINKYPHDLPVFNGLIPLGVSGEAEKAQMLVPLLLWLEHLGAKIFFLGGFPQKFWGDLHWYFEIGLWWSRLIWGKITELCLGFSWYIYIRIYNTLNGHFLIRKWWTFDRFWTLRISMFRIFRDPCDLQRDDATRGTHTASSFLELPTQHSTSSILA